MLVFDHLLPCARPCADVACKPRLPTGLCSGFDVERSVAFARSVEISRCNDAARPTCCRSLQGIFGRRKRWQGFLRHHQFPAHRIEINLPLMQGKDAGQRPRVIAAFFIHTFEKTRSNAIFGARVTLSVPLANPSASYVNVPVDLADANAVQSNLSLFLLKLKTSIRDVAVDA